MTMIPLKTYLEPDLARQITRQARAQGRSESSLIAEVLRSRFAVDAPNAQDAAEATQRRQLNRLEARLDKVVRDQMLVKECLLVFTRVWLEHNPPLDDDIAEASAASASARFERFIDLVLRGVQPGRSIADLPVAEDGFDATEREP